MKVTFIGATHEVTGSCSLLEVGNSAFLVDCGMEQGAVSYTHLDVYKRQIIPATAIISYLRIVLAFRMLR